MFVHQTCQPLNAKHLEVDWKKSGDSVKNQEILQFYKLPHSEHAQDSKTTFETNLKCFKQRLISKTVLELAVVCWDWDDQKG